MKALSLIEPWLQLIIAGKKTVEFRTWTRPWIVGRDLLLCSSKGWDEDNAEGMGFLGWLAEEQLAEAKRLRGHARCIVRVKGIVLARESVHGGQPGFAYHEDEMKTYAWEIEDVRPIEPFPVRGQAGIYDVVMPEDRKVSSECTVVNLRSEEYDIYIGRAGRGQDGYFGNPYRGERAEVLKNYERYFLDRLENDEEFRRRVLELKGKRLGCFCKPGPCHGDIIAAWVNAHTRETP